MTSFQKALLSARAARHGSIVRAPHGVPAGLALIGANLAGLTLTAATLAQEIDHAPALGAATVPDQTPAEEQPQHHAANATTGSIRTYRYKPRTTSPAHPSAPPPLHGDGLTAEVWS